MTRSSMRGFLRRLSDNPPNTAMRGFFFSRWIVSFRHLRGPSDVFVVALRRFDSFVTLVWFLLARVFRSDVSIVHLHSLAEPGYVPNHSIGPGPGIPPGSG